MRLARPLVGGLDAERGVDLLDGPLRLGEAAVGNAGDVPTLFGQIGADVTVDPRDLEQRDVLLARVGVAAGGLEQRGVDDGAERGRLGRERLRQLQVALGDEVGVYASA